MPELFGLVTLRSQEIMQAVVFVSAFVILASLPRISQAF
jgi:hypothetical protein